MSVLIKGLKMPIDQPARIYLDPNGQCFIDHGHWFENCKAVELQPHGRLIDVDYADKYAHDELEVAHNYLTNWEASRAMQKIYQNAPTIIPAERNKDG